MTKDELKEHIFIGLVEDNEDPKKLGRIKVRVAVVFDEIPTDDIPWAKPWKDLNGNQFNVPDIGKVVSVVFDDGNIYNPEYIFAEHYNINLENKLKKLEGSDYTSMKAIFFDHATQIYRNDTDGLKIDHEFSNITLDKYGNILLNLRDTQSLLTLGSRDSTENAVLGKTFMTWMDKLVENLIGANGGPYLANLGAPVVANPKLVECLTEYKEMRDKFISNHVYLPENGGIQPQSRPYIKQFGDGVTSKTEPTPYVPSSSDNLSNSTSYYSNTSDSDNPATKRSLDNSVDPPSSGSGWPMTKKDVNFADKWSNGVMPGKPLPDGTMQIQSMQGSRCWIVPNPEYLKLLVSVNVPTANGPKSVKVHPVFAEKLNPAFEEITKKGLNKYILSCEGGLAVRNVTGGKSLSFHAWGMAMDINADIYPYGFNFKTSNSKKGVEFDNGFIQAAKVLISHGVAWYRSKDAMHFSVNEFKSVNPEGN